MELIDALAENPAEKSVIDAGCGSGILAISARMLGREKYSASTATPRRCA